MRSGIGILTGAALAATPFLARATPPAARPPAFARCASCHSDAKGGGADVGPNLYGVAGSKAGSRAGYSYSAALRKSGVTWNKATLNRWLDNSQSVAPGTVMPNQTLKPADRDAIVTYLLTLR